MMAYCVMNGVVLIDSSSIPAPEERMAAYTANTWQPERTQAEINSNTSQGKRAENAFEAYASQFLNFEYVTYDRIRTDEYKKSAPFDGLLYRKAAGKEEILAGYVTRIQSEIAGNGYGHISSALRADMERDEIYTVEIKSTAVNEKKRTDSAGDLEKLLELINQDDYLAYPLYCRTSEDIDTFEKYCNFVYNCRETFGCARGKEFVNKLLKKEYDNMSMIQVRIYVDDKRFYIMGYTLKNDILRNHRIKKMVQPGKSELAVYYYQKIKDGHACNNLFSDRRLWK